jgi:hypothetical protein
MCRNSLAIAPPLVRYQTFSTGVVNPAKYRLRERDWCSEFQKTILN